VVWANQFVTGLLPEIKFKVFGSEGDFDHLLTRLNLSLGSVQFASPPPSVSQGFCATQNLTFVPQHMARFNVGPRCYNCGSNSHLIKG